VKRRNIMPIVSRRRVLRVALAALVGVTACGDDSELGPVEPAAVRPTSAEIVDDPPPARRDRRDRLDPVMAFAQAVPTGLSKA
jgi:hypothetical protein